MKYRPFARWWWFLGNVELAEIEREIQLIHNAGFGGAEVQPIYSASETNSISPGKEVVWLDQNWWYLLQCALKQGKDQEIQIDLTFGSGWPFGGPHITQDLASTRIAGFNDPLDPGKALEIPLEDLLENPTDMVAILGLERGESGQIIQTIDLAPFVQDEIVKWHVPPGRWELQWYFIEPTRQKVKRAAPGGEGLVLDHLNHEALEQHARAILTPLQDLLGDKLGQHFGAFFCDSWEVYGENWTRHFLSKFEERMRYDLRQFLPILPLNINQVIAILPENSDAGERLGNDDARVQYDYWKVHGDLILEEFFGQFQEICREVEVDCRVQPYCAPTDLLSAYAKADICEIEGFGEYGIGGHYYGKVDPRLASSAAQIFEKSLVSCESFTWLGEHFTVTLEDIKREVDQIFLHGINRIIYHGFPYSPPEAGIPGWVFYASILANQNNTWWPYLHLLNQYIARNAVIAQDGERVADYAVYLPIHDEWSGQDNALKDLRVKLRDAGHLSDFDYINDEAINQATFEGEFLKIGTGKYRALVFPHVSFLPLETAKKVSQLADAGMHLLIVGKRPTAVPGYSAFLRGEQEEIEGILSDLWTKRTCAFLESLAELSSWGRSRGFPPDFQDNSKNGLKYCHYRFPDSDWYLVVNETRKKVITGIKFRAVGSASVWDAIEGKERIVSPQEKSETNIILKLEFPPWSSKWVVFREPSEHSPEDEKEIEQYVLLKWQPELEIDGLWQIKFHQAPNEFPIEEEWTYIKESQNLFDWSQDPETQYFSGTAEYSTQFEIPQEFIKSRFQGASRTRVNLGDVFDIAEVTINGTHIGTAWWGTRIIEIPSSILKQGMNKIKIRVTNCLLNRVIGYARRGIPWKPDYYFVDKKYRPFAPENMELLPSGLLGPVVLERPD